MKRRIAITCGDPSGVGPEIIETILAARKLPDVEATLIGPKRWLDSLGSECSVHRVEVGDAQFEAIAGEPTIAGAKCAIDALELAAAGAKEGRFDALVTGPISKTFCAEAGFSFPGQTEFFAKRWGGEPTMAFVGKRLNVVLATWHIPLSAVAAALSESCIRKAVSEASGLSQRLGVTRPRIAVCGLNPHAGENGMLGEEERNWIDPLLDELRLKLPGLSVALPADTVFGRAMKGEFDIVVALYHDQGLAPLKTVEFDTAVNVTLGLPWLRTSPDHGTAFGIAGKGIASPTSFQNALSLAKTLI